MRTGALDLLRKIEEHRPGIVCFVGKKIWDEFEFVIKRSARPARKPWRHEAFQLGEGTCTSISSREEGHADEGLTDKIETMPTRSETISPSRSGKKIQWDQPRPYRVAHDATAEGFANTLFWVVPSTSGLVRVQVRRPAPCLGLKPHCYSGRSYQSKSSILKPLCGWST